MIASSIGVHTHNMDNSILVQKNDFIATIYEPGATDTVIPRIIAAQVYMMTMTMTMK